MKKVLILLFFLTSVNFLFSQNDNKNLFRKELNILINKNSLNLTEYKFNCYTKNDDICFDNEELINISYNDYLLIKDEDVLENKSKETILTYLKSISNIDFLNSLKNKCEYKNINFNLFYITNDYKKIEFKYFVNIERLISISENFNRKDAEFILTRL